MTRLARAGVLVVVLACLPPAAQAQLGELHLGGLASYGAEDAFGPGAGMVLGVAAGRLTYLGLRWTYHAGRTVPAGTPATPVEVTSRVQVFAVDLGILFPAGAFEFVPGASFGAARFAQRVGQPASVGEHDFEFFAAPGVSVQARLAGLLLIPELQYVLAGDPELTWPVRHRGPVASMRIVVGLEVGRIRR